MVSKPVLLVEPSKSRDGRSKVRSVIVPEFDNSGMLLQRCLDDSTLNSYPSTVHQPHLGKSGCRGRRDVFLDHRCNLSRIERVKIQFGFDRQSVSHGVWELGMGELGIGSHRSVES